VARREARSYSSALTFSETESQLAEQVSRFAQEKIAPKVREMDEAEMLNPSLLKDLFNQGLMGIEIPQKYGGAGMNFTSSIIAIEEIARVDPSVSILVDIHNTLINSAVMRYGNVESKDHWLPQLATSVVG
jgi:alkylation response protein AidB-like acyl-CoA dehydrogenase